VHGPPNPTAAFRGISNPTSHRRLDGEARQYNSDRYRTW
jgi:hypothetical protein